MKKINGLLLLLCVMMMNTVFASVPVYYTSIKQIVMNGSITLVTVAILLCFLEYHYAKSSKRWIYRGIFGVLFVFNFVVTLMALLMGKPQQAIFSSNFMQACWFILQIGLSFVAIIVSIYHMIRGIEAKKRKQEITEEHKRKLKKLVVSLFIIALIEVFLWCFISIATKLGVTFFNSDLIY